MLVKRLIWFLLTALVLVCCSKAQQDYLQVSPSDGSTEMSFDARGGNCKVAVSSTVDWTASSTADWVVLSFTSGNASSKVQPVTIWVNPNRGEKRSCTVVFSSKEFKTVFNISQSGSGQNTNPDTNPDIDPDTDPDIDPDQSDYKNAPDRTVAEFIAEANPEVYRKLTGLVSSFNSSTFEISLSDATGSIYVYEVVNKGDWTGKIHDNGTIVLSGKYHYYQGKRISEVVSAYILSFTPAGGANEPIPVTVAQFKAASASENQSYKLAGRVSNISNTYYGNFDLTDATGTLYVYGLTSTNLGYGTTNDKSFSSIGLNNGDEIVIIGFRADFNGSIEARYSYFVEKTGSSPDPGEGGDPGGGGEEDTPTCLVDFRSKLQELPQSNTDALKDGTFTWENLSFKIHAANGFYQGRVADVYHLLIGKEGSYILLPAIEGKTLTAIKFRTASQASENVIVDIATEDGTRLMINDTKLKKDTEYKWTVPGEVSEAYKLLIANSYNAQFHYIGLYYE